MRQAWTKLDQRQAHIIHRWVVEGWSVDEIAAETQLAVNHIYVLKHRGLKKLRKSAPTHSAASRFFSQARRTTRVRHDWSFPCGRELSPGRGSELTTPRAGVGSLRILESQLIRANDRGV